MCPKRGAARALIFLPFRARPHEPGSGALIAEREALSAFSAPRLRREREGPSTGAAAGGEERSAYTPLDEGPAMRHYSTFGQEHQNENAAFCSKDLAIMK